MSKEEIVLSKNEREQALKRMFGIGSKDVAKDIYHRIKSRFKILYLCTPEETRVRDLFNNFSIATGYRVYQWDMANGVIDILTNENVLADGDEVNSSPEAILRWILDEAKKQEQQIGEGVKPEGRVFILLDYHRFLQSDDGSEEGHPMIQRLLKTFSQTTSACAIVMVSPVLACPATLDKELTVIDFPHPSKQEISEALGYIKESIVTEYPKSVKFAEENEEEIVKAVSGLTLTEAEKAIARSLVKTRNFDIAEILEEKRQIIRKTGMLEYRDPKFVMDDIGGLDNLQQWLMTRKLSFSEDARDFGLPAPKGVLLLGVPGTGKSMTCDALANLYQMPLLRLDFGALFGSHVGQSERNIRECLKVAESISPCVLWIDEIEKGISGTGSSNESDGGTTARVFGTFLTWMQDKEGTVFVACTANSVSSIPPEFMRAGRFDEIFFVDLPDKEQRVEVLSKILLKKKRNPEEFDLEKIAAFSENYSPSEIEKGIDGALFKAFSESKRDLVTQDVIESIESFPSLYSTCKESIDSLRSWALGEKGKGGRAVLANGSVSESLDSTKKNKTSSKKPTPKKRAATTLDLDV